MGGGGFGCRFFPLFSIIIFDIKTQKKLKTILSYGIIIMASEYYE